MEPRTTEEFQARQEKYAAWKPKYPCQIYGSSDQRFFVCGRVLEETGYKHLIHKAACEKCKGSDSELLSDIKNFTEWTHASKTMREIAELKSRAIRTSFPTLFKRALLASKRAAGYYLTHGKIREAQNVKEEKLICCTTCGTGSKCPYCECILDWKSSLLSENNCPNKNTAAYANLAAYPPYNFWGVTREMTSVLMPCRKEKYLNETLASLLTNFTGKYEVIVILDGPDNAKIRIQDDRIKVIEHKKPLGRPKSINEAARIAQGKYLIVVDGHCSFSPGYDTKLKCLCDDRTIVTPVIARIHKDTWEPVRGILGVFGYISQGMCPEWYTKKPMHECNIAESTMAFMGCGWMIQKKWFWQLEGFVEQLKFGDEVYNMGEFQNGAEWALKAYLHKSYPGRVLVRTDCVVGHVLSLGKRGYAPTCWSADKISMLWHMTYGKKLYPLLKAFWPLPDWPSNYLSSYEKIHGNIAPLLMTGFRYSNKIIDERLRRTSSKRKQATNKKKKSGCGGCG